MLSSNNTILFVLSNDKLYIADEANICTPQLVTIQTDNITHLLMQNGRIKFVHTNNGEVRSGSECSNTTTLVKESKTVCS